IGGILVYRNNKLTKDSVKTFDKGIGYDSIWLSIPKPNMKPIYISINYIRPFHKETLNKTKKIFNNLQQKVIHYKNKCSDMYVIGDFNARIGHLSGDVHKHTKRPNFNGYTKLMQRFLINSALSVANGQWTNGIPTSLGTKHLNQGSIVDYVLDNNPANINDMKVDIHPIFYDHRPIILSIKGADCTYTAANSHYSFRNYLPNEELTK
ncbi:MAG: hypothetical protein GY938_07260, partial [Ketobacter sp.]|nr:hypothetical protein [Ketobacter sp.]